MKRGFFQAVVISMLLYGCTTWTLTKRLEKKLDGNYTSSPGGNTPQDTNCTATCPLSRKLFKLDRTRHAGHCWRSRDELIRDVLLWTPTHGRAKAGRPARTYFQQLCEGTECCPEDQPKAMNDREEWQERVSATWWWWWWWSSGWDSVIRLYVKITSDILCVMIQDRF